VFGAGCVQYSWGLDDFHDNITAMRGPRANPYSHRVNRDPYGAVKAMQQATVNLFADMGIQPANLQPDLVPAVQSIDLKAPLSKITSPPGGAGVAGGAVAITGTAADTGGTVAMVEISVDGGRSWKRAAGTDRWQYEWIVPDGAGSATILTRAVDDSVNVETPGKGVTVTYGRGQVTSSAAR
jgi:hypothetical protein